MSIDLRLMLYVIEVADAGSFSAAAQRLHMTQPPLSRQIRELERFLGVELFHRRPTRLTAAGEVFVESARHILAEAEQAVERTRQAAGAQATTVRVGYTVTAAFEEMPKLLAAMHEQHPAIRVKAHEAWDTDLTAALDNNSIDIVLGRRVALPPGSHKAVLRRDKLAVVVSTEHPLAKHDTISLTDLRGETIRFFPRRYAPHYYDSVLASLTSTGEAFDIWENPLPGLRNLNLHLTGQGFMVLPHSVAQQLPHNVRCLSIKNHLPTIDLEIAWRQPATSPVKALIQTARQLSRREHWIQHPT